MDRRLFLGAAGAASFWATQSHAAISGSVLDDVLEQVLKLSPETATSYGLDTGPRAGLKHRLDDRTRAHRFSFYDAIVDAHQAIAAIAPGDDPKQQVLQQTALWVGDTLKPFRKFGYGGIGGYSYPVPYVLSQLTGAYQALPDFMASQHVINTADDAEAFIDRLAGFSVAVDLETERMRADVASGAAPPNFIIDRTLSQLQSFQAAQHGPSGAMTASVAKRAAAKGIAGAWGERAQKLVDGPLAEAIARQKAMIEGMRAGARTSAGVGPLPDGDAYYAACLRFHTSTDLTPDAAHKLGLEQVAEVSAEARKALDANGVSQGSVAQGIKHVWEDPANNFPNTDEGRAAVLAFIADRLKDMTERLPRAFNTLPKTRLEVKRVPVETELGAPGAYSQSGSVDGSRPGAIYFNLHDTGNWPRIGIPTTAYHEGLPGHHLQGSIANEATGLPALFKILGFNAYNEGWALYAEQLADELGAYDAFPLGRIGRLQGSLFRACRIVVDTGMHAKGWSREKAIAYLIENAGSTAEDARREIERYCAWPGQACGYKIGHLEFLRLRKLARAQLGAKFDIRRFHDTVLLNGSMPLAVMGHAVDAWVARGGV